MIKWQLCCIWLYYLCHFIVELDSCDRIILVVFLCILVVAVSMAKVPETVYENHLATGEQPITFTDISHVTVEEVCNWKLVYWPIDCTALHISSFLRDLWKLRDIKVFHVWSKPGDHHWFVYSTGKLSCLVVVGVI